MARHDRFQDPDASPRLSRDTGGQACPQSPLAPETDGAGSLTPLSCFEVLAVNGADGERFLQGQTSQQLALVDGSLAPLTAFCTPKGWILAMAQLMRLSEDCLWLLMPTGTAEPLRAHLAKFAPFYKVSLEVREDSVVVGLTGEPALTRAAEQLADAASHSTPRLARMILPCWQPRMPCLPASRGQRWHEAYWSALMRR
ncbi:hypothetical protein ACU8V3_02300 [Cobetia marina]